MGSKAFFSVSYSSLSQQLIASSADRHIRLYDTRSTSINPALFFSSAQLILHVNITSSPWAMKLSWFEDAYFCPLFRGILSSKVGQTDLLFGLRS